jgi:hypothetical protein
MAETGERRIASYLTKICGKVVPLYRFSGRLILNSTCTWLPDLATLLRNKLGLYIDLP